MRGVMELNCPVCGSEDVYRGLTRRKQIAIWWLGMMFIPAAVAYPPLTFVLLLWAAYPFVLPFMEYWKCRNCGARLVAD
ncbi:MAG: hypothetical protein ACLGH0_12855 [Thermoanaerobaculia bacterium]